MTYSFDDLIQIVARLRAEDGCPWDKAQDTLSLLPYLIEECCEFIDAATENNPLHACEELGDVLLQVVFHSQVAKEKGHYKIDDVIQKISEKMIRRHPHVFGGTPLQSKESIRLEWERIKSLEQKDSKKKSTMDKVAKSMPSLFRAEELQRRALKVGFDAREDEKFYQLSQEFTEFISEKSSDNRPERDFLEKKLGELLFSLVGVSRRLGLNATTALMHANSNFERRFRKMEALAGGPLNEKTESEIRELWARTDE